MSLISVIMPVKNGEAYIGEAIESILAQTHTEIELIIINDGSTDMTHEMVCRYAEQDSRVVYKQHPKSEGHWKRINEGVSISKGAYIARMDADDVALPHRFKTQLVTLLENDLDLVGSCAEVINENGEYISTLSVPENNNDIRVFLGSESPFVHPSILYKREFFKLPYKALETRQDYLWFCDNIGPNDKVGNCQEALIKYRRHSSNTSSPQKNPLSKFAIAHYQCRTHPVSAFIIMETFREIGSVETSRKSSKHTQKNDLKLRTKTASLNTCFNHLCFQSFWSYFGAYIQLALTCFSAKALYRHLRYALTMLRNGKEIETRAYSFQSNNFPEHV